LRNWLGSKIALLQLSISGWRDALSATHEFVRLKVDAIVRSGGAVGAVKQVTSIIPINFAVASDPLAGSTWRIHK